MQDAPRPVLPSDTTENQIANKLQHFLSRTGIVNSQVRDDSNHYGQEDYEEETIFESSLDLTEDRMRFVFNMFDTDKDGNISIESLRRGLEYHATGSNFRSTGRMSLDDLSFQELVSTIDLTGSGDIQFEEFKEGIRLLMLRALMVQPSSDVYDPYHGSACHAMLEVMDYDATRLERRLVLPSPEMTVDTLSQFCSFVSSPVALKTLKTNDFYFDRRPSWVKIRWINVVIVPPHPNVDFSSEVVSLSARDVASLTMRRLAVKYLLHPLALEDALETNRRPKVEGYSDHYFVMIPIFSIDRVNSEAMPKTKDSVRSNPHSHRSSNRNNTQFVSTGTLNSKEHSSNFSSSFRAKREGPPKLQVRMVSVFLNVPKDDTIITFTNALNKAVSPSDHHLYRVQRELEKSYSKLRQYDAQYLLYALLDLAVDLIFPIVKTMRREIEFERDFLLEHGYAYTPQPLQRVHAIRHELEKVVRKIKPFARVLTHVIEDDAISAGATIYLRDVLDNLECVDEDLRQLIGDCQLFDFEEENFFVRQRDRTLYFLTVISSIFFPAQFLTGVWGMNFSNMPELDEDWGYPMFWILTILSASLFVYLTLWRNVSPY